MADTLAFWKMLETGVFDVYLSQVVFQEIDECYEPKRSLMYQHLKGISYNEVLLDRKVFEFAQKIVDLNILKKSSFDDCQHISASIFTECDYIVSWNFKHLVNVNSIQNIRKIITDEGKKLIDIVTPSYFLNMGDENG